MATKKKNKLSVDAYKRISVENEIRAELLEKAKKEFSFPFDSVLEIGTGLGDYLTRFLVTSERAKDIGKFYAMEPIDEFFEESKRHVVRLSRTDATSQEYFGGNPFDAITFAFVLNHITPDKKAKFLENVYKNLTDDDGKIIIIDAFVPQYKNEEGKKKNTEKFIKSHVAYHKEHDGDTYPMNYYYNVLNETHDDFFIGEYKTSVDEVKTILEDVGYENIKVKLFKGKNKADWKSMGYYTITAEKTW